MASRNFHRRSPGGAPRSRGHLADYERFKHAYEQLLRDEPDNLVALTLVQMDLDRSRCVLLGLPVPPAMRFDLEGG